MLEADEPSYRQVFRQGLTALQGVSDRVEWAELGTAYARLDGLEALYGGEGWVVAALLEAVPRYLTPRVGDPRPVPAIVSVVALGSSVGVAAGGSVAVGADPGAEGVSVGAAWGIAGRVLHAARAATNKSRKNQGVKTPEL